MLLNENDIMRLVTSKQASCKRLITTPKLHS